MVKIRHLGWMVNGGWWMVMSIFDGEGSSQDLTVVKMRDRICGRI